MTIHATSAAMRNSLRRRTTKLLLCAAGAAALTAAAMAPAAAMVGPIGVGTTSCNAGYSGTMTFSPKLVNAGAATTESVGLKMKFTGCTGGTPVPAAGVYTANGIVTGAGANNCANWFTVPLGTPPLVVFSTHLAGDVVWSPSSISPSVVGFAHMRIYTGAAGHLFIRLPGGGSTVTGSYTPTANLDLRTAQNYTSVAASCGGAGLGSLTIVPSNPSPSAGTW